MDVHASALRRPSPLRAVSLGRTHPTGMVSQEGAQHLASPTDGSASLLLPSRPAPPRQAPYLVPIALWDWGQPALSSTATVTVSVCRCRPDGSVASCRPEAQLSPAGLSTGALLAIITCVGTLLGESGHLGTWMWGLSLQGVERGASSLDPAKSTLGLEGSPMLGFSRYLVCPREELWPRVPDITSPQ